MTTYSAAVSNNAPTSDDSIKATNLMRFLNDPKDFSGQVIATRSDRAHMITNNRLENSPLVWLKKLEWLRDLAKLSDKELLLIAADHLVGEAGIWFDIVCPSIVSWSEFLMAFKKKFCTGLEDIWWRYVYDKREQEEESVEDVDMELRELFSLVILKDEHLKVRHFMDAIHKPIAWEVERKSKITTTGSSLDQVVEAAVKAESVMKKYDVKYSKNHLECKLHGNSMVDGYDSSDSCDSIVSPPKLMPTPRNGFASDNSSLSTGKMDRLLSEFHDVKFSTLKIQVCLFGNQPGRIKTNCEEFKSHVAGKQQQQNSPATGVNAEPIGVDDHNNNEQNPQVNIVFVDPVDNLAAKPINSVCLGKRTRSNKGTAINQPKTRKRRNRKLPLTVNKLNAWDVLKRTNANLFISDLLSVDKAAAMDLLDGIKTLRARKKSRTETADGQINIAPMDQNHEAAIVWINRVNTGARSNQADLLFGDDSSTVDKDSYDDDGYTTDDDTDDNDSTTSSNITPFQEIGNPSRMGAIRIPSNVS
ncbi:hypothetical protein FB192DRAFT_1340693 [Mucor lusitanicus]|uniref:Retrotransposon gag domain-containing protein n=1 Tax=Mucor circinelloides f. lusitanicus TaxID=29924 RepID=A0A8H4BIY2_MUCCL|nr:hypothetical protein FB192DRAFT_1340693 [Mucor lusitanicus]